MLLTILIFVAIIPFALVGFLYREAHIDLRQALVSGTATLAAVTLLAGIIAVV
jgi:hypothetical protein